MSINKELLEEYTEVFHRPNGSMRLLTKSQARFIRAVMRCNQINEISRTIHEQQERDTKKKN